nr:4-oxalocrotonate tautomerase 4-oxalocrotonate tautomerase [Paraburkholderia sp.]
MEGHANEQKARLIDALTQAAIDSIGAPRGSIRVLLLEVPKTNFGIGGTTAHERGRCAALRRIHRQGKQA